MTLRRDNGRAAARLCLAVVLLPLAAPSRPGNPPQCYERHLCISTFVIGGTPWYYDLSSLCAAEGSEYSVWQVGVPPDPATFPQIIFNVCGTVARDIAPYAANNPGSNVILPFPASHGVAIQLIDDPSTGPGAGQVCADVDTCDQATNPTCLVGSLNYDATRTGNNPNVPTIPIEHNPAREDACVADPSTDFCTVQAVDCTENSEVLAAYTGGEYTLGEGLDVRLNANNDPAGGLNLTWANLPAFSSDPFVCHTTDPATGLVTPRSVNIFIACDAAAVGLVVESYSEPVECSYYITARAAAACGSTDSPYVPSPSFTPTNTPASTGTPTHTSSHSRTASASPPPLPVAAAAPSGGTNFGFTLLGALVIAPAAVFAVGWANGRGFLDRPKSIAPAWLLAAPGWLASGGSPAAVAAALRPAPGSSEGDALIPAAASPRYNAWSQNE